MNCVCSSLPESDHPNISKSKQMYSHQSKKFTVTPENKALFQKSFPTVANTRFWSDFVKW